MERKTRWTCVDCMFSTTDAERAKDHELGEGHTTHPIRP